MRLPSPDVGDRSVTEAAGNSGAVAQTVAGVAATTAQGAASTQQAATDLTRLADEITTIVAGLRTDSRVASGRG